MEKNYYTDYSCYGCYEGDYSQYVSDTEYMEIKREKEKEARTKELVTN